MSTRDDAWALWASLGQLSNDRFDELSLLVRSRLPTKLRDTIKAEVPAGLGKVGALLELKVITEKMPAHDGDAALAVWISIAKEQLGDRFSERLDDRRKSLSEPGRDPAAMGGAEKAKVDLRDDLVGIEWLTLGRRAAEAVAFLTVPRYFAGARNKEVVGTGFVMTLDKQHIMTACHVVDAREPSEQAPSPSDLARQLAELTVSFDFHAASDRGHPILGADLVVFDRDLDYAILRLPQPIAAEPLVLFTGGLPTVDGGLGFVANIIQHPMRDGTPQPKQLGLRNNAVWKYDDHKLYYFTDTRAGSSGSPVLSDGWQVYAVHTGYDVVNPISYVGRNFAFANRGTLMSKVVTHAKPRLPAGVALRLS